eukprot:5906725-Amphidinium_carterae.1
MSYCASLQILVRARWTVELGSPKLRTLSVRLTCWVSLQEHDGKFRFGSPCVPGTQDESALAKNVLAPL